MTPGQPKWRRRKEARPAEIVAAALEVFAEKGFASARLDDIAARAGVSKGALYLYFETKQDLFTAVVREAILPNLDAVEAMARTADVPFAALARMLLTRIGELLSTSALGAVAKMVIAESRNFPDLARVWHEEVVLRALSIVGLVVERAQARGELKPGAPRYVAFSLVGPMLMGALWNETFTPVGAEPADLRALAAQHIDTVLTGLLADGGRS
jgi:AcrR family transcriptional regulator